MIATRIQRNPSTGRIIRRAATGRVLRVKYHGCDVCVDLNYSTPRFLRIELADWTDCGCNYSQYARWFSRLPVGVVQHVNREFILENTAYMTPEEATGLVTAHVGPCIYFYKETGDFGVVKIYYHFSIYEANCEESYLFDTVPVTNLEFRLILLSNTRAHASLAFTGTGFDGRLSEFYVLGDVKGPWVHLTLDTSENCFAIAEKTLSVTSNPGGCVGSSWPPQMDTVGQCICYWTLQDTYSKWCHPSMIAIPGSIRGEIYRP